MKHQNPKEDKLINPVLIRGRVFAYRGPTQFDEENLPKNPGPGCYDVDESYHLLSKSQYGSYFGSSPRFPESKELESLPGPGTYQSLQNKQINKSPAYSISKGKRKDLLLNNYSVGPGSYYIKQELFDPKRGISIKGFTKSNEDSSLYSAGPGSYDLDVRKSFKSPVKYTKSNLGLKKTIFYYDNHNPGPAHYEISQNHKEGSSQKKGSSLAYELDTPKKYTPKEKALVIPGPGQYDVDERFSSKYTGSGIQSGAFSFAKSIVKDESLSHKVPGPGSYLNEKTSSLKNNSFNKKTTFAMSNRPNLNADVGVPGPGSYLQPEKLLDLDGLREKLKNIKKSSILTSKKVTPSVQSTMKPFELSGSPKSLMEESTQLNTSFQNKDKSISFPHSERKNEFLDVKYVRSPGPKYNVGEETAKKVGGAFPRSENIKSFIPYNKNPGVGEYDIPSGLELKKNYRYLYRK